MGPYPSVLESCRVSDLPAIAEPAPPECVSPEQLGDSGASPYDRIVAKMMRQHRLLSLHWELTYRCNETCTHCYLDVLKPNAKVAGELSTDEITALLDQFAAMGALNVTFSGGEVLVRRDWFDIAQHARRRRFSVRLFSNGILITPQVADRIAALTPFMVEISLYGADALTHETITRRRRSWELTLRAFRLLHERGVRTQMKTPLMHENVRQLPALRELAASLGAGFRYDPTITAKDNGDLAPLDHRLDYDDMLWLHRQEIPEDAVAPTPIGDAHRSCAIGLHALVIDPYGNVFPCVQTRISGGNLREQPMSEIWNAPIFQRAGQLTFDVLPVCRSCELNAICHRCHANALVETGDMYAPALANCRDALARRQVMVEKGILPADFPIPAHLRQDFRSQAQPPTANLIPLSAIQRVPLAPKRDMALA